MSGCAIGQGDLTFGTLAAEFLAEDGFTIDGKKVPAVKCTPASASVEEYGAGNMADYGQLTGTMICDPNTLTTDLNSLIGTSATLTVTLPVFTSGQTAGQWSGTAIFLEAPQTTSPNELMKGACVFQWTSAPTPTNETA